eukprot:TRINITY_DN5351_c1_g1_i1.p1 TRINITY_DN5351_c1_g1~~TRINITY_DN5351_c1_g1_i1.p1  ORF type:complete len:641 (-),score=-1.02 TRINITY_DN5351_c1_g1_i1:142-2064(-)
MRAPLAFKRPLFVLVPSIFALLVFTLDDYLVLRHPSVCRLDPPGSAAHDDQGAGIPSLPGGAFDAAHHGRQCAHEYRIARRSLGILPVSPADVVAQMALTGLARLDAVGALAAGIRRGSGRMNRWVRLATEDCAEQLENARYYSALARNGIQQDRDASDVPYWLATAAAQIRDCVSGFHERSDVALRLAGSAVEPIAARAIGSLQTLTAVTMTKAQNARNSPVRRGGVVRRGGRRLDEETRAEPDWVQPGLYEALKAMQARMEDEAEAEAEWAEHNRARVLREAGGSAVEGEHYTPLDGSQRRDLQQQTQQAPSPSPQKQQQQQQAVPSTSPQKVVPRPSKAGGLVANVTVDKSGRGDFRKLKDAIAAAPKTGLWVIYLRSGTYKEQVLFSRAKTILVGAGATKTTITESKSVVGGTTTYKSATVGNSRGQFAAIGIRFVNTAGPSNHQAVAMRASGDRSAFFDCVFEGNQDTLYVDSGRQYYRNCFIGGTIDFIFGDAAAVIDNATIQLHPSQTITITASGRDTPTSPTGIVIWNSTILTDAGVGTAYLGRPWRACARTVLVNTYLPQGIAPDGWLSWNQADCLYYAQYGSIGPGASSLPWVSWAQPWNITMDDAKQYAPDNFTGVNSWWNVGKKVPKW